MITSSPATRSSRWRKSAWWLTRCPAMTALPISPGIAVPGQWPGPLLSVDSRMPSNIWAESPMAGISIDPTSTRGSVVPSSAGGASGTGSELLGGGGGAAIVVVDDDDDDDAVVVEEVLVDAVGLVVVE